MILSKKFVVYISPPFSSVYIFKNFFFFSFLLVNCQTLKRSPLCPLATFLYMFPGVSIEAKKSIQQKMALYFLLPFQVGGPQNKTFFSILSSNFFCYTFLTPPFFPLFFFFFKYTGASSWKNFFFVFFYMLDTPSSSSGREVNPQL